MRQYTDQGFLKLFRLTQLSLEYLLNVQDTLYTQAITLKSKCLFLVAHAEFCTCSEHVGQVPFLMMLAAHSCILDLKLRQETKQRLENANDRDQEILHLKKDNKRKAQLIATYQQTLSNEQKSNLAIQNGPSVVPISASAATSISRCPYCPKAFSAPHFLQKHIQRKHRDRATEQTQIEFQQHMARNNQPTLDEERMSGLRHSASSQARL